MDKNELEELNKERIERLGFDSKEEYLQWKKERKQARNRYGRKDDR